ncbi:MAG: restriction endonuclease subunit S [Oscillospiraceae bacterium]|nr:restriction endonuclease subunit S [Oscillospiraceae bacterium]
MTNYKSYKLTDIFSIKNTKCVLSRDIIEKSGKTPYLTASQSNNAVGAYVNYDEKYLDKGNCIYIGGKTFVVSYQERDFYSNDSHNLVLYLKNEHKKTKENQLFMVAAIKKSLGTKYSWGDSISHTKIQTDTVSLPEDNNGEPDYDFMTTYIRELELSKIKELENHLKAIGWTDCPLTEKEAEFLNNYRKVMVYKPFKIESILEWQSQREIRPIDIDKYRTVDGKKYPFYGQATLNNGIISYLPLTDSVLNNKSGKPTILVHSNNQNIVYVETPFYLKDGHGATSVLQGEYLNRENALFIITCIKKVITSIYSYNEKATKTALKNTIIQLPVDDDDKPNYDYMAFYTNILQKLAIKNMIDRQKRELRA